MQIHIVYFNSIIILENIIIPSTSLMRSDQGNFHIFVKCKQLILIDIMSKRRCHV